MQTVVATRACGDRVAGGIYLTVPTSPDGAVVDNFLIDPPRPVDMTAMGLSSIGTTIIEKTSDKGDRNTYVMDVVGQSHYPNVSDFIEEARRHGISRRIARNADFSRLTSQSRLILIHARGYITNSGEYHLARPKDEWWCPRNIPSHIRPEFTGMCASLWWEDLHEGAISTASEGCPEGVMLRGRNVNDDQPGFHMHRRRHEPRAVVRPMVGFSYRGLRRPENVTPQYVYAQVASFPIGLIEVVTDKAGGTHTEAIERARKSRVEVREVER